MPEPGAAVPESVVAALLASVALSSSESGGEVVTAGEIPEPAVAPTIWTTGRFRQGIQLGAHHKPQAEYIGSTARARRRLARLAALDAQIASGEQAATGTRSAIDTLGGLLAEIDAARTALPSAAPLLEAIRTIDRTAAAVRAINGELDNARSDFDRAVAAVGGTERQLATAAAARAMPRTTAGVDQIAAAVARFGREAGALDAARRTAAMRHEQLTGAGDEVESAREEQQAASEQAEISGTDHRARAEELATLRGAVGVEVAQLERDIDTTGGELLAADLAVRHAQQAVETAIEDAGKREGLANGAASALISAVTEAQRDSHRLAPFARSDVRDVLRLPAGTPPWPTAAEQWTDADGLTTAATQALTRQSGRGRRRDSGARRGAAFRDHGGNR